MVEKIEKVVNHRAVVFDTEKFEMLKNSIEKIIIIHDINIYAQTVQDEVKKLVKSD